MSTTFDSPAIWVGFVALVVAMLALDLGVLQRRAHTPSAREALGWSIVWVALACAFGGWVAYHAGAESASQYFTAYVVEKSLSVDNLFVFLLVFGALRIPEAVQHRVLFWGILGALVLRGAMIVAGTTLLHRFHWLIYVFGALLIFGAAKIVAEWRKGADHAPEEGRLMRWVRNTLPMSNELDGQRFFTRSPDGRWLGTPLLGALVLIEASDLVFAVDSIPAVLAISDEPFIVYTSNVFAILGLRSLYLVLARVLHQIQELKLGLAAVLAFVGVKMLLSDVVHVSSEISLGIIVALLGISVLSTVVRRKLEGRASRRAVAAETEASARRSDRSEADSDRIRSTQTASGAL